MNKNYIKIIKRLLNGFVKFLYEGPSSTVEFEISLLLYLTEIPKMRSQFESKAVF